MTEGYEKLNSIKRVFLITVDCLRADHVSCVARAYGFAEAVVRIYKDRKFAAELGWNGRRYVSEKLTVEQIGEHMQAVFVSVAIPNC